MKYLNPTLLSIIGYAILIVYLVGRTPLPIETKTPYFFMCAILILITTLACIYIDELFIENKKKVT